MAQRVQGLVAQQVFDVIQVGSGPYHLGGATNCAGTCAGLRSCQRRCAGAGKLTATVLAVKKRSPSQQPVRSNSTVALHYFTSSNAVLSSPFLTG
jgi:hypothetical protein